MKNGTLLGNPGAFLTLSSFHTAKNLTGANKSTHRSTIVGALVSLISLCIITKNESNMLPGCLESAKDWVDEIIVADTGSDDDTVAIAKSMGAKVVYHTWTDDFAAARNVALKAATGKWVLVLDADERLAPGSGPVLRKAVKNATFDLACLPLHNAKELDATPKAILEGSARIGEPQLLPRLIRRTSDLAWRGAIHESVTDWVVEGKRKVEAVPVHIIHLGAVPSYRISKQKRARNVGLLKKRCVAEPMNPSPWSYLAYEYIGMGETTLAREAAEEAWSRICAQRHDGPFNHAIVPTANALSHLQNQGGDMDAALETLKIAIKWNGDHPNLYFLQGVAWEQKGYRSTHLKKRAVFFERGEAAFKKCLALHGRIFSDEINPGATSWAVNIRLGSVYLRQGRAQAALKAFTLAKSQNPEGQEPIFGEIEAILNGGDARAALTMAEAIIHGEKSEGDDSLPAEPYYLAALACEKLNRMKTASILLARAARRAKEGALSPPRRKVLRDLLVCVAIHQKTKVTGSGVVGHLAALLSRKAVEPPEGEGVDLVDASAPEIQMVQRILVRLIGSGRGQELEPLLEPRAEQVVPGIGKMLRETLKGYGVDIEEEDDPNPIFIGGAGRSGTTLFRAMMDSHPAISCGPEAKLVPVILGMKKTWWDTMGSQLESAGVSESDLENAAGAFIKVLLKGIESKNPGTRIAEKTPHNLVHMAMLGRQFPRAKFIHVIRDGRAVAASLVRQGWVDSATGKPLMYCQNVENAARYWGSVIQSVNTQIAEVEGRYLEVRYEALVLDPKGTMAKVMAFLGEEWRDDVLKHHEADLTLPDSESSSDQVVEAVHTRAISAWRTKMTTQELTQVEGVIGPMLVKLGYLKADEFADGMAKAG